MQLWGWKTDALLDVWSIEHFIGGIVIGGLILYFLKKKNKKESRKNLINYLLIIIGLAYLWEFTEYFLENGISGINAVTYWFQGQEYWGNRLFTDPLFITLGALSARKFTKTIIPATAIYITWFIIHIFIFPHAMYLQEIF